VTEHRQELATGIGRVLINAQIAASLHGAGRPHSERRTCPLRQLQEWRYSSRIYRPSSVPRSGLGSCDRRHGLPIIFWMPRGAASSSARRSQPRFSGHNHRLSKKRTLTGSFVRHTRAVNIVGTAWGAAAPAHAPSVENGSPPSKRTSTRSWPKPLDLRLERGFDRPVRRLNGGHARPGIGDKASLPDALDLRTLLREFASAQD
jgi:hypothetical protein